MSQFCGYTVEITLKNPPNTQFKGIISKVVDKQVVVSDPVYLNGEKCKEKELFIKGSDIEDLKVVELAQKKKNKNQKKKAKQEKSAEGQQKKIKNGNIKSEKDIKRKEMKQQSEPELELESQPQLNRQPSQNQKITNMENNQVDWNDNNRKVKQLEEFDFASNLQKFDKASVFKELSLQDKINPEMRLVSHNKIDPDKVKYSNDEMVLKKQVDQWDNIDQTNKDLSNFDSKRTNSNMSSERKVSISPGSAQLFSADMDGVVPTCSPLQLSDIQYLAKEKFGISKSILHENSGRSIAGLIIKDIIRDFRIGFKNHNVPPLVLLLVGNNRAGHISLIAGRNLFNHGVRTIAFLLYDKEKSEDELLPEVESELNTFIAIGGKTVNGIKQLESLLSKLDSPLEFIVDGLQGYDSDLNDLMEPDLALATSLVNWCNNSGLPIMSIDIPSGLNPSSGNSDNELFLVSKYIVSIGIPLTSLLNIYKFGYFNKRDLIHYVVDCGLPKKIFAAKSNLRKFDRQWFAVTFSLKLEIS